MSREHEVGLKVRELRDSFESVESKSVSNIFSLSFDLWEQVAERVSRKATHKLLLNPAFRGRLSPPRFGGGSGLKLVWASGRAQQSAVSPRFGGGSGLKPRTAQ